MSTPEYCVYNETRENVLTLRVAFLDTRSDPLRAVKVLIEGLAPNADTGLWLNPLKNVPSVPRLSAYDLVYLDRDGCVVHGVELVPDDEAPRVDGSAASALLLPIHSFAASQAAPGDRFVLRRAEEIGNAASVPAVEVRAVVAEAVKATETFAPATCASTSTGESDLVATVPAKVVSLAPEPSAVVEKAGPDALGPLTWPVKMSAQSTALERVNPLAKIQAPARKRPLLPWLHQLPHVRIRVQISIVSSAPEVSEANTMRLPRNAGPSRAQRLAETAKSVVAGVNAGVRSRSAKGAAMVGRQWTACKAGYARWAESFVFRPAQRPASVPPVPMLPPPARLDSIRKPRFLR